MPVEHDFMKSARDKEMPEEEFKTLYDEYNRKAEDFSNKLKKLIFALLIILAVSFVFLYLTDILRENKPAEAMPYTWLIAGFLLAIFLYDPKAEEIKKQKYETDKKIRLNSIKSRISMIKIKFGLVIGLGALLLFLNGFVWWWNFVYVGSYADNLRLIDLFYNFI